MLPPPTTLPAAAAAASDADFARALLVFAGLLLIPARHRIRRAVRRRPAVNWIGPDGNPIYRLYMKSKAWRKRCRRIVRKWGGRCRWNGNYLTYPPGGDFLNVGWRSGCRQRKVDGHHLTYEHLGAERVDEVVPLCRHHHSLVSTRPHPPFEEQQVFFGVRRPAERPGDQLAADPRP